LHVTVVVTVLGEHVFVEVTRCVVGGHVLATMIGMVGLVVGVQDVLVTVTEVIVLVGG